MNREDPDKPVKQSPQNPIRGARTESLQLSIRLRIALFVAGLIGLTLLTIAFRLTPDPNGFGTHQKLGFPPCTFIELFEIPCPSCGMTTSWSHMSRGNLFLAFRSNAGGAMLFLSTLILSPWFLASAIIGRWWISPPDMLTGFFILLGITLTTIIQWLIWVIFFPI